MFVGLTILSGLGLVPSARPVIADDVIVVSERLFDFSKYPDKGLYGWSSVEGIRGEVQVPCYVESLVMNQARNLTPPISQLAATVRLPETCVQTHYGRLEAVSPTGNRVVSSNLTGKDFQGLCQLNCAISTTRKQYSSLGCAYQRCYEELFFAYLKFPRGTEPGQWFLELTLYWSENVTSGSLTTTQKFSKLIRFPEPLTIAVTEAPTTTSVPTSTTSTMVVTTTTQGPSLTVPPAVAGDLRGTWCPKVGRTRRTAAGTFVCVDKGMSLQWQRRRA